VRVLSKNTGTLRWALPDSPIRNLAAVDQPASPKGFSDSAEPRMLVTMNASEPTPMTPAPAVPADTTDAPATAADTPPRPQPRNPLHGLTLETMVTELSEYFGWEGLGERIPVRCFQSDPSVASSLKFLRKTPWAREKVEGLYLFM